MSVSGDQMHSFWFALLDTEASTWWGIKVSASSCVCDSSYQDWISPKVSTKTWGDNGKYEMLMVSRSLFAVDGSLYIPTDIARLMHAVENASTDPLEVAPQPAMDGSKEESSVSVLIVDSMGVLQSMKKTPTMVKLSDFQEAFNKWIEKMMAGYDEGWIVFDRYIDQSLKNKTWQKRANTSIEYEIHLQIKLIMSIEELLSASSTKKKLTCMMGQGLLDYFSREVHFYLTLSMIPLSRE